MTHHQPLQVTPLQPAEVIVAACACAASAGVHAALVSEHLRESAALGMARHAICLLTQRRLADDIERHGDDAQLIVLPPPCPLRIQPIDFDHADELIRRGAQEARRFFRGAASTGLRSRSAGTMSRSVASSYLSEAMLIVFATSVACAVPSGSCTG